MTCTHTLHVHVSVVYVSVCMWLTIKTSNFLNSTWFIPTVHGRCASRTFLDKNAPLFLQVSLSLCVCVYMLEHSLELSGRILLFLLCSLLVSLGYWPYATSVEPCILAVLKHFAPKPTDVRAAVPTGPTNDWLTSSHFHTVDPSLLHSCLLSTPPLCVYLYLMFMFRVHAPCFVSCVTPSSVRILLTKVAANCVPAQIFYLSDRRPN